MSEGTNPLAAALQHLVAAETVISKSLRWIKQQCTTGKGLSNVELDAHQLAELPLRTSNL